MLTKEYVRELFEYKDGDLYWKVRPSPRSRRRVGDKAGCPFSNGRRIVGIDNRQYLIHRVIFLWHHGWVPTRVDHIIDVAAIKDNRVENLRPATAAENTWNAKLCKRNTSGHKGVSWHLKAKKWYVQVSASNASVYRGLFEDIELAELFAIEARDKYHKEFARHK